MRKKYTSVWLDSMGTGIMKTEGQYDKENKTLTETGTVATPMGPMQFKMVNQCQGDNQFTLTMYMVQPDGSEQKKHGNRLPPRVE